MKTIQFKKILSAFLIMLVLSCLNVPALAEEAPTINWAKTGSVSVTLKDKDTAVSGAEITLYHVALAEKIENALCFVYTDGFKGFGGSPEALTDEAAVWRLVDYTVKNHLSGQSAKTDENGTVSFQNLPLGLYLAVQTGSVQGYLDCTPFLVALPTGEADGWVYDIDATPKTDVVRLIDISVKKVWNDNGQDRPDSVTVQLLKGKTVIDTVELSEQNGWNYTWKDQPRNDTYSVKELNVPKGYTVTYQHNEFTYTVTNTSTLVQTGQLKWPIPVLAGAGLLLFIGGWAFYFKEKRKA